MKVSLKDSVRSLFSISDEQAMWRVQKQDDEGAFAQLVRRWEGPIQRVCVRMVGDERRGEDLAQEAFIRVFGKRKDYRAGTKFSTWIWRIALNLCYDELRRRYRRKEMSLDEPGSDTVALMEVAAGPEPSPDEVLMKQEHGDWVRNALLQLPEIYRSVLILRHYEDLKFRQIAEVLDLPEGTVKSRTAEALTQMRVLLEPQTGAAKSERRQQGVNSEKKSLIV